MSLWRHLTRGLRVLTNRAASDRLIDDEAQHYLDQVTEEFIARGYSPDEARRAARLQCGTAASIREQVRDYGWENTVETFWSDIRYAARRLRTDPGFTAVTVFTLALGIGATTAIFSTVKPVLFESLPYPDAARIVTIWNIVGDGGRIEGAFGAYREISRQARSFEAIAATRPWQPTITSETEPERLEGQRVSSGYFRVLGITPALGRDFQTDHDRLNGPNVVILSDSLWRRRFGGDLAIVGSEITLDGNPYSVLGVMPPAFENVVAPDAQIFAPLQYDISQGRAWGHHLKWVARLRPGVEMKQASVELDSLWPSIRKEYPRELFAQGLAIVSLQDYLTEAVRPALIAVMASVLFLLMIACVNVTNLLLARGARRQAEFAIRASLGAGRSRMIRQLLTESLLLAAIGGGLGVLVAEAGVRAMVALSPAELPRAGKITLDGSVLAFGIGITTLAGLAFGLIPAIQAARHGAEAGLRHHTRTVTGAHRATRNMLVVAEVGLAFVLLVGAGLLLRSMERLFSVSPGLRSTQLLTMKVQTSGQRMQNEAAVQRFFSNTLEAARNVPGVVSAAYTSQLPMSGERDEYGVHLETNSPELAREGRSTFRYTVTPSYFETTGIPLLRGRLLESTDNDGAPLVAVVSESFAKRRLRGIDPIGQRVRIGPTDGPLYTIVGIVGDVKQLSLARSEADAIYVAPLQWRFTDQALTLIVRTEADSASLAPALRRAIWSIDKDQPIVRVATMEELLLLSAAQRRFVMTIVAAFALVALALAAAGVYGVLSGSVAERTREIGIRSALGASSNKILGLIIRQGLTLTLFGAAIGLIGAIGASGAMASLLFGISSLDPATYLGMFILLLAVSATACSLPAWRASQVDPTITLRSE
jgi:putative ABC transport system permease protein